MSGSLWLVCDTDSVAFSFYIGGGGGNLFEKDVNPMTVSKEFHKYLWCPGNNILKNCFKYLSISIIFFNSPLTETTSSDHVPSVTSLYFSMNSVNEMETWNLWGYGESLVAFRACIAWLRILKYCYKTNEAKISKTLSQKRNNILQAVFYKLNIINHWQQPRLLFKL